MRIVAIVLCTLTTLAVERAFADSSLFSGIQQASTSDMLHVDASIDYVAGTEELTMSSNLGININLPGGDFVAGLFELIANTAANPELDGQAISGTLNVTGEISGLGFTDDPLLTGTVTAFRSLPAFSSSIYSQMEFVFNVTGGDAADLYGGAGGVGSVVVSSIPSTTSNFESNFNNNTVSGANIDTAAIVPEPSSFLLAAFGVLGVAFGNRLRRKLRQQS